MTSPLLLVCLRSVILKYISYILTAVFVSKLLNLFQVNVICAGWNGIYGHKLLQYDVKSKYAFVNLLYIQILI
jgi:hypothetical protein